MSSNLLIQIFTFLGIFGAFYVVIFLLVKVFFYFKQEKPRHYLPEFVAFILTTIATIICFFIVNTMVIEVKDKLVAQLTPPIEEGFKSDVIIGVYKGLVTSSVFGLDDPKHVGSGQYVCEIRQLDTGNFLLQLLHIEQNEKIEATFKVIDNLLVFDKASDFLGIASVRHSEYFTEFVSNNNSPTKYKFTK